jgi:hypothetical protein
MRRSIFALLILFLPPVSSAHHSFNATFDPGRTIEIEGQVTRVIWRNPHVRFTVSVPGDDEEWHIETHSVSILSRMQVDASILAVGDKIKLAGNPSKQPVNAMFARNVLLQNGDEVVLDPRSKPRWQDKGVESKEYWVAPQVSGLESGAGIFRVWSTVLADPESFPLMPEGFDPNFDISSYPLTAAARNAYTAFNPLTDTPTLDCAPKGMPTIMEQPYPMEFIEGENSITVRLEEYDTVRTIHLGDSVSTPSPSPLGVSVGHWEEAALVVTTTAVSWPHFDTVGIPLSNAVEIVERFTPSEDGSRLNYEMRVTDPATFTDTVVLNKYWLAAAGVSVEPYLCTN